MQLSQLIHSNTTLIGSLDHSSSLKLFNPKDPNNLFQIVKKSISKAFSATHLSGVKFFAFVETQILYHFLWKLFPFNFVKSLSCFFKGSLSTSCLAFEASCEGQGKCLSYWYSTSWWAAVCLGPCCGCCPQSSGGYIRRALVFLWGNTVRGRL